MRCVRSSAHPILAIAVSCLLGMSVAAGLARPADAQLTVPSRNDALCRKDLHTRLAKLVGDSASQLAQCHKRRLKEKVTPATDCNDTANVASPIKLQRGAEKLRIRARKSCTERRDVQLPSGLGYDACPAPCAAVSIAEDYENGVAACLVCLAEAHVESTFSTALASPSIPATRSESKCQNLVAAAVQKYFANRMKVQRACQSDKDVGRVAPTVDCASDDLRGRLAHARSRLATAIGKCSDTDLATLPGCGGSVVASQACITAAVEAAADALFAAVYRTVPATPTPTAPPTSSPTPSPTPTATATASSTPTVTATPTSTPTPTGARLEITLESTALSPRSVTLSGSRLSGPDPDGRATTYGPVVVAQAAGGNDLRLVHGLAPGAWLHSIDATETGQQQFRQSLVVDDPNAPNELDWGVFDEVLVVTDGSDAGDGTCDATCTLRDAILAANSASAPVLIRFAVAASTVTQLTALAIQNDGAMLDGTDSTGEPSPIEAFGVRTYPVTVTLVAPNLAPGPGDCPCTEGDGGAIRIQAENVVLRGVRIQRQLAPEGTICCGDQDLVAFDASSRNSLLDTALLDGGAAAISDANVPPAMTFPATGKDCVDAQDTGATSVDPIVVDNSELRFCFDRGLKSKQGVVRIQDSWVHHNLRGGLFAQSPDFGSTLGIIESQGNLVEQNGQNCPSGDATNCGITQAITRTEASEISAQGSNTRLVTDADVVRDGVLQGLYFQDEAQGEIRDEYVCGINRGSGGKGILVKKATGTDEEIRVRGSAFVYNDDAGAKLDDQVSADFGLDGGSDAGNNAFAENGGIPRRNFVNVLVPAPLVPANGNQWENCYSGAMPTAGSCDALAISDNDTNNDIGMINRVDVGFPDAHADSGAMTVTEISPTKRTSGGIVRIRGTGFDAVSGHSGGVTGDCTDLATGNGCTPLRGMCVEFLVDGIWTEASDVLGVTPTTITVRTPMDCAGPTLVRLRRPDFDEAEVVSNTIHFCENGG